MKQPGKSPSSLSSRSLPWCRVMCSIPTPWPGCLDGSNSSVTSSWPTVKSWPKLLAMEEIELRESVEMERLSWAMPVGSSSLLISSRWPRSLRPSGVSPRAKLGLRLEVVEVRRWLLAATLLVKGTKKNKKLPVTVAGTTRLFKKISYMVECILAQKEFMLNCLYCQCLVKCVLIFVIQDIS